MIRKNRKKMRLILKTGVVLMIMLSFTARAFAQKDVDKKAFDIMNKAFGNTIENGDVAMYFEGIGMGLKDPMEIFTLPVYKITRGGYLIIKNKKYEMAIGPMKTVCDGKILVVADEVSKTLFIDSVRNALKGSYQETPDVSKIFTEKFGAANLSYEGKEMVNKRECHKIRSFYSEEKIEVTYWVECKTGMMYLMAEKQNGMNMVYWFRKISKAPEKYTFNIHLPKKNQELDKLYGYQVIDHRFTKEQLTKKK